MPSIKFGPNQRSSPTPRSIDWSFNLAIEILGYLLIVTNSEIGDMVSEKTQHLFGVVVGLIISLLNRLRPFFGVDTGHKRKIDIDDVDVMENKK